MKVDIVMFDNVDEDVKSILAWYYPLKDKSSKLSETLRKIALCLEIVENG